MLRDQRVRGITQRLDRQSSTMPLITPEDPSSYRVVPADSGGRADEGNFWRIYCYVLPDLAEGFGLDIYDDCIMGREGSKPNQVSLSAYDAELLGVSREHILLRPTNDKLLLLDMGSTNGTLKNGKIVGQFVPHNLLDNDVLMLGNLGLVVRVLKQPAQKPPDRQVDLAAALSHVTRSITSKLELGAILSQALEIAASLVVADETSIWLVDEVTGELMLEARFDSRDHNAFHRMRMAAGDTLAGQVIKTGQSIRIARGAGDPRIKIKTNYLADALMYAPLALGGITFGVVSAIKHGIDVSFSEQDESILNRIADAAAVAIQNARLYEATDSALTARIQELAALSQLSMVISSSLNPADVYEELTRQVRRHWDIDALDLWLRDDVNGTYSRIAYLLNEPYPRQKLPRYSVHHGVVGEVMRTGSPIFGNHAEDYPAFDPECDAPEGLMVHSFVVVPLMVRGHVIGALGLFNKRDAAFDQEDVEYLQRFANPVASALQNARLHEISERERDTIHEMTNALSQPLLIFDSRGDLIVSNRAAQDMLTTYNLELFQGLMDIRNGTSELTVGEYTFVATVEDKPDLGTIIVMHDISYVRRLETARAEFVRALSHDLKGPIASIRGYANLLERMYTLDERANKLKTGILQGTDQLIVMVNALLNIALLAENPEVERTPVNLPDLARNAVELLQGAAMIKSINIRLLIEGQPYAIYGDEKRLQSSLFNLIDNAVKYSDKGSILVSLMFSEQDIVIKVRDDGPGISDEDMPDIFNRFYRGSRHVVKPGVGLGLALVLSTVSSHKGSISVQNVKDHGAEFIITLPHTLRIAPD
ncbi:MAG: GAF domain-containing protein [Anaerolineae bacterium]|nr:GAF domain-containing protein [Anaerolineae bacterium]